MEARVIEFRLWGFVSHCCHTTLHCAHWSPNWCNQDALCAKINTREHMKSTHKAHTTNIKTLITYRTIRVHITTHKTVAIASRRRAVSSLFGFATPLDLDRVWFFNLQSTCPLSRRTGTVHYCNKYKCHHNCVSTVTPRNASLN